MWWSSLHDQPSSCDQASHSNKLLHIQLQVTHIKEMAAANSDPAGSWLMPGISKTQWPGLSFCWRADGCDSSVACVILGVNSGGGGKKEKKQTHKRVQGQGSLEVYELHNLQATGSRWVLSPLVDRLVEVSSGALNFLPSWPVPSHDPWLCRRHPRRRRWADVPGWGLPITGCPMLH